LERIINTPDFVDVRYLEAGLSGASRVDPASSSSPHSFGSTVP
jgi:hypothetical protein